MDNNSNSNSGDGQTIEIVIILIAAIVVFFLVIAWCGFFYGLWKNRNTALDLSRIQQYRQQQYRRQQLLKQQQQQQQHNVPQRVYQQRSQYTPQQQRQLQQQLRQQLQLRQQQNAGRSARPSSSQLSSNISRTDFTHQAQYPAQYPQTPYHGESISIHSGYITPVAAVVPVFIPPRDYDDDQTPLDAVASSSMSSSGLDHSYHNRTFDYFEASSSQNQSFSNICYQPTVSYPESAVSFNQSNTRSAGLGYSPAQPRSTSTPVVPKMQAKHKRISQPPSFENYSMEMQQYQQLQHWPQNY